MHSSITARILALLLSIAATLVFVRAIAVYALPPAPAAEVELAATSAEPTSPQ